MEIRCYTEEQGMVSWLRKREMDLEPKLLLGEDGVVQTQNGSIATLTIKGIHAQHSGVYFCQQNCQKGLPSKGCSTELRVMGVFGACPPIRVGEGATGPRSLCRAIHTRPRLPLVGGGGHSVKVAMAVDLPGEPLRRS